MEKRKIRKGNYVFGKLLILGYGKFCQLQLQQKFGWLFWEVLRIDEQTFSLILSWLRYISFIILNWFCEDFNIKYCDQAFLKNFGKLWISAAHAIISIATKIMVSFLESSISMENLFLLYFSFLFLIFIRWFWILINSKDGKNNWKFFFYYFE